jgi:uncharacterized protein
MPFSWRSDRPGQQWIRLLHTADLHGSNLAFRKFLGAVRQYHAQHALIGGDLTGKAIIPVVKQGGRYEAWLFGNQEVAETEAELRRLQEKIGDVGFYDHVCDAQEARELDADKERQHTLFVEKMNQRLTGWLVFACEFLEPLGVPLWLIPGNDDDFSVDPVLAGAEYARNVDHQIVELDGHELVSMGDTSMTPWACPRDYPEEHMQRVVSELLGKVRDPGRAIFNFHCPPRDTKIDQCPALNDRLEVQHGGGQVVLASAGSAAIRKGIEDTQPLLSLHGHIHEARGVHWLGRTLALNPGSEYAEGTMKAAIVNLEPTRVKGYLLISG